VSAGDYFLKLQTLCAWYYVVEATEKMKVLCIYPFVSSSCAFLCQVDRVYMMDRVPHVSAGLSTLDNARDTLPINAGYIFQRWRKCSFGIERKGKLWRLRHFCQSVRLP
jgi:hypothetical protein